MRVWFSVLDLPTLDLRRGTLAINVEPGFAR